MARVEPFAIGGDEVAPGRRRRLEIPVARLPTGTWVSLPVEVLHGRRPGPRVWINGAIHGDEVNGVAVVRRVMGRLRASRLCGTVIGVPVVNVFGFITLDRYLPDRRDLNRSFPGSPRGSMAAQLAHLFFTEVVARCDLGIDLHSGSNFRENLPQIRGDFTDPVTRRLAAAFGAPVMLHSALRRGSLREAATSRGKQVLLYEAGEALRYDERYVHMGERGVLRVLTAVGAWSDPVEPPKRPTLESRQSIWGRASRSGLLEIDVELGQQVAQRQELGRIYNTFGNEHSTVRAPEEGIVIALSRAAHVNRGEAVVHIARADGGPFD